MNIRVLITFVFCIAVPGQQAFADSDNSEALLEALRSDGYVLYWRHTLTNQDERDYRVSRHDGIPDEEIMADCGSQRNLSERGREQAENMGRLLRKVGFVAGSIQSSSYCRNLETAEIGFPRKDLEVNDPALFNQPALARESKIDGVIDKLQGLLSDPPDDANRVIVGHNLNLQSAADVRLNEGEMALFRPKGDDGFELVAAFGEEDLVSLTESADEVTEAWRQEDAEEQAVAVYQHIKDVEATLDDAWTDTTSSLKRSRLRNAARLELARRLQDDSSVKLTLIDYYLVLARAAVDDGARSRLHQVQGAGSTSTHPVSDVATNVARDKAWMHGNESLHPAGRVPHIEVAQAVEYLAERKSEDIIGDVIEVTGMLDFSFLKRAKEHNIPHGFYVLSAHDPEGSVFSDLICVRDDVLELDFGLPWPEGDGLSEAEREEAILSNIRFSDNGFEAYTQRNLLGTTPLGGKILNAVAMRDCRTFLK